MQKEILKPKILYDLQVLGSTSLNVYSNDIVYLLWSILKHDHQIVDIQNVGFPLKVNIGDRKKIPEDTKH